ncbi:MAG TPA: hypothetical protein VII94_06100 [Candidatus Saccharimonadales bacterium]
MTTITTKLVPDGNSIVIRLPKQVIIMSGLGGVVQLSVKRGQITMRKPRSLREDWSQKIKQEIASNGPLIMTDNYGDMLGENDATLRDGFKNLTAYH